MEWSGRTSLSCTSSRSIYESREARNEANRVICFRRSSPTILTMLLTLVTSVLFDHPIIITVSIRTSRAISCSIW
jgi:hypothetical protein